MNKCISKGHKAERMRVKKDKLKSFFNQKGNCCSKKPSSRKREIKKIKDQI